MSIEVAMSTYKRGIRKRQKTGFVKALETTYNGYRFRSRLEARWAVFFDTLGVEYYYEPEGYDLGSAGWYLPDFWLPKLGMFAEVKARALTWEEKAKAKALAWSASPVLRLEGPPAFRPYWAYVRHENEEREATYALTAASEFCECSGYDYMDKKSFSDDYVRAVYAARGARFDHGQNGAPNVW